jgi:hypothetical protein
MVLWSKQGGQADGKEGAQRKAGFCGRCNRPRAVSGLADICREHWVSEFAALHAPSMDLEHARRCFETGETGTASNSV